jgi:microcystin-dependent protein
VGGDTDNWGHDLNDDLTAIDAFLRNIVPAGTIFPYAGPAAVGSEPEGFLYCDGRAVSRTAYASLFAAITTSWGGGDGSSTFNLPDLRSRFPIGAGPDYALTAAGGAANATPTLSLSVDGTALTTDQLPAHSHSAADSGHSHGLSTDGSGVGLNDPGHSHDLIENVDNAGPLASTPTFTTATVNNLRIGVVSTTTSDTTGLSVTDPGHTHTVASGAASVTIGNTGSGNPHTHTGTVTGSILPPYRAVNYIIKT